MQKLLAGQPLCNCTETMHTPMPCKSVIREINNRVEEFEQKYTEVENESKARLKEAKDSQLKVSELQETIERLELNLSNLESENQVLRQQALVASIHEDVSEEMKIQYPTKFDAAPKAIIELN
ncbi:hypothetical protein U1Q18_010674 [Sarracenia purpurea var. burkii]